MRGAPAGPQDPEGDRKQDALEAMIAAERREADLLRRRGDPRGAVRILDDLLEDEPTDAASRTLRALAQLARGKVDRALEDARRALEDSRETGDSELGAECARNLVGILLELGRTAEAIEVLDAATDVLDPQRDVRDAWSLGHALDTRGDRVGARVVFEHALYAPEPAGWRALLAKGRCEHALGRLQRASQTLVAADAAARREDGTEPDILVALADLYFESEKEVAARGQRSAGRLYREALEIHPHHEDALLGLFQLHRYNRRRASRTPESILEELLGSNPRSIDGLLASASSGLEDGQLRAVRRDLKTLDELAPGRREKRTLDAALAWVEHRRDDCEAILEDLARSAAEDSRPEREVGRHLVELYRFAESLDFLERAVERDPTDYLAWTYLGRAQANVGREDDARESFEKAEIAAAGRQDAWRNNMALVLARMKEQMVEEDFGELSFAWQPDAAEVLRTYLVPFYRDAREELAERYGHTPSPTHIEVFRRHEDFSVRSVGFQGFPALGVCFGPVVTSLSPLSEMRGNFSWARTSFHEFSHVIHLGLSHNRCPRWITEGLATWEEVNKNPTWTRNMRRELVDARANGQIIPVRELNRAFRGPRIIFGYYQGGLLCRMLIREHGFRPMIRILEAFDRGLDIDQALDEVFGTTPEEVDEQFLRFVDEFLEGIEIEPRWSSGVLARLRVTLPKEPPAGEGPEVRERWAEDWCTVAWGSWQAGSRIDAEEALRLVERAGMKPLRAAFLRGEMALGANERRRAREIWTEAVEAGGRDYRALLALGALQEEHGLGDLADATYELAEAAFPGYDDRGLSAELRLARLYEKRGDEDEAMRARERWLAWNAGELPMRRKVAAWHFEQGRFADANRLFAEANEIDIFLRDLHRDWGRSLQAEGRWEDALREYRVAALVPPELDGDHGGLAGIHGGRPAPTIPDLSGDPDDPGDPGDPGERDDPDDLGDPDDPDDLGPGSDPDDDGSVEPQAELPGPGLEGGAEIGEPVPLTHAERAQLLAWSAECLLALGREEEARSAAADARALDADCELPEELTK